MKLVIIGYGNPSRGDDAIGPLLLNKIADCNFENISCFEDFQLQIIHSLDLEGMDMALFIDAGMNTQAPFFFKQIHASGELITHTSHSLAPQTVLDIYIKIKGKTPPPAFLLCVAGESFGLGDDLSQNGQINLNQAWDFILPLLQNPNLEKWQKAEI
jgi:hydrogenase maturation protease